MDLLELIRSSQLNRGVSIVPQTNSSVRPDSSNGHSTPAQDSVTPARGPDQRQPGLPSADPCQICKSPLFWQSAYKTIHCENCLKPASESMVVARYLVINYPAAPAWERFHRHGDQQQPLPSSTAGPLGGPPPDMTIEQWW